MLLPEESHPVENLLRARSCRLEALLQLRVLDFQPLDAFGVDPAPAGSRLERLYTTLGLERATTERCELVAKVTNELLKLRE